MVNSPTQFHPVWEEKVWGRTCEISYSPHCLACRLQILPGTYCSKHFHRQRINRFYVCSGKIRVVTYDGDDETPYILETGDGMDVPTMVLHRFEGLEAAEVWEIYTPQTATDIVLRDDVVRITVGGRFGDSPDGSWNDMDCT